MTTIAQRQVGGVAGWRPRVAEGIGRRMVRAAVPRMGVGALVIADGSQRTASPGAERGSERLSATVRVVNPAFYSAVAWRGSIGAAESYLAGDWECDDVASLIELLLRNYDAMRSLESPLAKVFGGLRRAGALAVRNSRPGSRRNIHAHYDLSNEFFGLWLDESMTYSCGVFAEPGMDLHAAQVEKIDRACRKLGLTERDHLLEIGTGWGSAAIHAARVYGCRVTTTTISKEQHALATRRIAEAGLDHRVEVLLADYRDLAGTYDKLLSIEMIEAVGREYLDRFFRVCSERLAPHGRAVIQAITIRDAYYAAAARRVDFLKKYIFPGSCLLGLEAMTRSIRRCTDLRPTHVEDLGLHYARTLRLWLEAFDAKQRQVREMGFDERFRRMWRYYLQYCEGAFRAGHCSTVQMVLAKPDADAWRPGEPIQSPVR